MLTLAFRRTTKIEESTSFSVRKGRRAARMAGLALLATLVALAALPGAAQEPPDSAEARRIRESITVMNEVMAIADTAIPTAIAKRAEAIAIFPNTVKAGFIFGGVRGRGILSARTDSGWTPPTFMTLTGGSFGLQIGGQATDIVLIVTNRRGLEHFVRNQFKFGADASVAAGPVGRDAQANTDLALLAEILSYSRARGLFAGVTINGSTVRADLDANERFFGKRFTGPQIVLDNADVEAPTPVAEWIQTLSRHAAR
jgi:lipid-binding SYLF domain-containing protein